MSPEENIKKNNIILPQAPDPVGAYAAAKISGNLIFISGQVSKRADGKLITGKVGEDLNLEQAQKARVCGLNILSQPKNLCGNLGKVKVV